MKKIGLFVLLLLSIIFSFAQQRQKVGVVLSGGGARGLAHVGVLKALEEAQIPIDYIAGTSVGAIVGGLYSAGYSVSEIERLFLSKEFQLWLQGKVDQNYLYFYKQKADNPSFVSFSFDTKDKFRFQLPTSIVNPIQMDYAFMEIFAGASVVSNNNFDSLFIPFFCVATDIGENKSTIIRSGDLGQAVRASMTFPFYFSPISINGRVMFDGGMYNNFPSKEIQEIYKPDIIIGVKVAGNYSPPMEGDVVSYLQNIFTNKTDFSLCSEKGVLIEPNLSSFGIFDYSKMEKCLQVGYDSTIHKIQDIRNIIKDSISVDELNQKRKNFNQRKPILGINTITINGVTESQKEFLVKSLMYSTKKGKFSSKILRDNYFNLYSDFNIKSIQPYLYYNNLSKSYVLNMNVKTKQYLTSKIGGIFSTNPVSHLFLGFDYNLLKKNSYLFQANMYAGRYYNSYSFRTRTDYSTKFPLYSEIEFNANKWSYYRLKTNFFDYSPLNYLVQNENNVQLSLGYPSSKKDKIFINLGYGKTEDEYFNYNNISIYDTTDNTIFRNIASGITRIYSSLDSPQFPTTGLYSKLQFQYISGIEIFEPGNTSSRTKGSIQKHNWVQFLLKHQQYIGITKHYSIGFNVDIFYSLQHLFSNYTSSLLNAGIYTPTLETLTQYYPEYRANQFAAMGVENIFKINLFQSDASVRLSGYVFAPFSKIITLNNNIPVYSDNFFSKYYFVLSSAIVLKTPVGPLSIIAGYHQRDNVKENPYTISVNFGYIIFNKKNIDR